MSDGPRHVSAAPSSVGSIFPFRFRSQPPRLVFADGHDEQSLASHGIAGFGRAEYSCRNAVAQPFQWRDDGVELSFRVPRHVLSEDNIRPALLRDADDFGREKSLSLGPGALSGN